VLEGKEDFLELNDVDLWLGGVHLQSEKNEWRLEGESGHLRHNGA
jgi:hypothetical protein